MTKSFITLASIFIWTGCVIGISFMEAWLKFKAPGVTLPIGLGIGKLVFTALNRTEWVLAITIFISHISQRSGPYFLYWFALPFFILLLQTFWLLPALQARAEAIISGKLIPPSPLHLCFIIGETLKVILLFLAGWKYFKSTFVK